MPTCVKVINRQAHHEHDGRRYIDIGVRQAHGDVALIFDLTLENQVSKKCAYQSTWSAEERCWIAARDDENCESQDDWKQGEQNQVLIVVKFARTKVRDPSSGAKAEEIVQENGIEEERNYRRAIEVRANKFPRFEGIANCGGCDCK